MAVAVPLLTTDPEADVMALVGHSCPVDPRLVIVAIRWALTRALVWRGGTAHLRTCIASGVHSRQYPCSDACVQVQVALGWAAVWLAAAAREG